jgi:hypothetical protein
MKLTSQQVQLVESAPPVKLTYALHLASLGMKVFPLKPQGKTPADRGWADQATSDQFVIRSWFEDRPNINYGVACGPSGLLVVDLDTKNGIDGIANWRAISSQLELSTFEVDTPNRGKHLYFWGQGLPNSAGTIGKGIDLRASGGYVVGPGSQIPEGTYSSGLPWHFPDTQEIQTASEPLIELLRSRKGAESVEPNGVLTAPGVPVSKPLTNLQAEVLGRVFNKMLSAPEGRRNQTLNDCAFAIGALVREGAIIRAEAESGLLGLALSIGLSEVESKATIQSGLTSGVLKGDPVSPGKSKYEALDLLLWLSQDHPKPEPIGSGEVIYAPALIWVMGEPASGKSFLCLQWALDVMKSGKSVIWLDEEAGPGDTIHKLRALGATDIQLHKLFRYLPPEGRSLQAEAQELRHFVEESNPGLIVMDSAAALLANANINENDNSPVGAFMNKAVLPLVKDLEIPTVVIDHKTKNNVNTSYARGASSKLGVVDLALNVELKESFSKEQSGSFEVRVNKDRAGIHTKDKLWKVKVDVANEQVRLIFGEPRIPAQGKPQNKFQDLGQKILDHVKANPGSSKNSVESSISGASNQKIRQALFELIEAEALVSKPNGRNRGLYIAMSDSPE